MQKNMVEGENNIKTVSYALSKQAEAGFSLLLVLLFVGLIASVFSGFLYYQSSAAIDRDARAAGWHLVEVSKAARLFARNRSIPGNEAALTSNGAIICCTAANVQGQAGSIEITVGDLIAANHLPAGFPARNPLGQDLRIFISSYPPSTTPMTSSLPIASYVMTTSPAAGRAAAIVGERTAVSLTEGARDAGMSVSAPLFLSGVNNSDTCGGSGQPSVMIWDTGCLTQADVNIITGAAGGIAVAAGQVIVPTWRAVDHDLRALMRYPQPENPTANTMLTDMLFANPLGEVAGVETYTSDTGAANNRVNLNNLGNVTLSSLIVSPQATDFGGETGTVSAPTQALRAGSISVNNDLSVATDASVIPQAVLLNTGQIVMNGTQVRADDMDVLNTINMDAGAAPLTWNTSNVTATNATNVDRLQTNSIASTPGGAGPTPQISIAAGSYIADTIDNINELNSDGGVRVFNQVDGSGSLVNVNNTAQYTGIADSSGSGVGTTFSARFGLISNTNTNIAGRAYFPSGGSFIPSNSIILNGLHTDTCSGDCPDETTNDPTDPTP